MDIIRDSEVPEGMFPTTWQTSNGKPANSQSIYVLEYMSCRDSSRANQVYSPWALLATVHSNIF